MARHVLDGHGGDVGRPLVLGELPYRAISHQGDVITLISAHEVVSYRFTPGVDCIPDTQAALVSPGRDLRFGAVVDRSGLGSPLHVRYSGARTHYTCLNYLKESSYQTPRNRKPPALPLVVGETTWA